MDRCTSGLEHSGVVVCSPLPPCGPASTELLYGFLAPGTRRFLDWISGPTLAGLSLGSAGNLTYLQLYVTHMPVTCYVMA